ncbi:unnamed protein product [Rhodiola kirilowii]
MEKEAREVKSKNKLMKYLPRAASALTFQNPRVSPGREAKPRHSDAYRNRAHAAQTAAQNRAFSGPLASLVPMEARGNKKEKKEDGRRGDGGFDSDVEEPRSPKISCIGQIKEKKKLNKLKREKSKKLEKVKKSQAKTEDKGAKNKPISGLGNIFRRKNTSGSAEKTVVKVAPPPPGLSQMKRFSSGRDAFANFDWTKQVAPVDRECYSDDDEQRRDWDDDDEEEEDGGRSDVMIPFSAPMMIGGGNYYGEGDVIKLEPRKEICLWKKRNMAPPQPLKLNTFR